MEQAAYQSGVTAYPTNLAGDTQSVGKMPPARVLRPVSHFQPVRTGDHSLTGTKLVVRGKRPIYPPTVASMRCNSSSAPRTRLILTFKRATIPILQSVTASVEPV